MAPEILQIKVISNAKAFEFLEPANQQEKIVLKTKSPAQHNKANQEIIRELSRKFKQRVTILKGLKQSRKIIQIG